MPIYTYNVLNVHSNEVRNIEIFQDINDIPFTVGPKSGMPIKRVMFSGADIHNKGLKRSTRVNKLSAAATACGCSKGKML
jgi:predicted nucleic acid-binding Zn ribbon protein